MALATWCACVSMVESQNFSMAQENVKGNPTYVVVL